MSIVHVVTFTFAADVLDEVTTPLATALDELASRSNVIAYRHGPDAGFRDGNAHYAVTAVFNDQRAFESYLDDPLHRRITHELVAPHLRSRSAVQFHERTVARTPAGDTEHDLGPHRDMRFTAFS